MRMTIQTTFLSMFCCVVFLTPAFGESIEEVTAVEEVDEHGENYPVIDRAVNVMFADTLKKHSLLFIVDHRNWKPIADDTFRDFLGFDAGNLKVGLGLRYGLWENLEIGIYRLNGTVETFDVYEFDGKFQIHHEEDDFFDTAIRGGGTWFYQSEEEDAAGGFAQFLMNKTIHKRFKLGTGVLYHSESSNEEKMDTDDEYSVAIPAILDVKISDFLTWNVEVVSTVAGYDSEYPAISSSLKFIVHGHTFSIILSNTQYTSADGIVSNSPRGFGDTILGFNITREFHL